MNINPAGMNPGEIRWNSRNLQPGDSVAVRVVRRTGPFRYRIAFRGQEYPVNSAVLLKPGDVVLMELVQSRPRFQFKFLSLLKIPGSSSEISQLTGSLGFADNSFSQLFTYWCIRLNLPLKKSTYRQLKNLPGEPGQGDEIRNNLLLGYFWLETNFQEIPFADRLSLLRWLFHNPAEKKRGKASEKTGEETNKTEEFTLSGFLSGEGTIAAQLHSIINRGKPGPDGAATKEAAGNSAGAYDSEVSAGLKGDILLFLALQQENANSGKWIAVPVKGETEGERFLSFWRRSGKSREVKYEFAFRRDSRNFDVVEVTGSIMNDRLDVNIYCGHQDFRFLVDKYLSKLKMYLKKSGLNLENFRLHPVSGKSDIVWKLVLEPTGNKIEVLI